jgi:hypothetical protein
VSGSAPASVQFLSPSFPFILCSSLYENLSTV